MNKKEKLAFAFVAALAMTSGGFAFGQSVNNVSSDQVIYACVTGINGNITKVSNTPKTCPRGTTPISWNMVGPKGDQGIQGLPGSQGPKGDPGVSEPLIGAGSAFLAGPLGQKYFYNDLAAGFNVDGNIWIWNGHYLEGSSLRYTGTYFTSENCTGSPFFNTGERNWWQLAFSSVYTHPAVSQGNINFTISDSGIESAGLLRSTWDFRNSKCVSQSPAKARESIDRFAKHLDDLGDELSSFPQDAFDMNLDIRTCTVSTYKRFWQFDDCLDSQDEIDFMYFMYPELDNFGWIPFRTFDDASRLATLRSAANELRSYTSSVYSSLSKNLTTVDQTIERPDVSSQEGWQIGY